MGAQNDSQAPFPRLKALLIACRDHLLHDAQPDGIFSPHIGLEPFVSMPRCTQKSNGGTHRVVGHTTLAVVLQKPFDSARFEDATDYGCPFREWMTDFSI